MANKKDIFFKEDLDNLPFFFRNYEIKELKISKNYDVIYSDQIPAYHSESVECSLPQKPISKILTFDEQKKF